LKARGETKAELYGMPEGKEAAEVGPLHAFFLLLDKPQTYNLPEVPRLPRKTMAQRYGWSAVVGVGFALVGALVLGGRR
jgi:formate dehydrogenase iron-sulfur subunit